MTNITDKNNESRVAALNAYEVMDTTIEEEYNEIVELAANISDTPISLITLFDHQRQWVKAKTGIDKVEALKEKTFCNYTIEQQAVFTVEDATKDDRFSENPLVINEPKIMFYSGVPLVTPEGVSIGALCVLDTKPRKLTTGQNRALEILGKQVIKQLELKKALKEKRNINNELEKLVRFKNKVFSIISHDLRGPIGSISQVLGLMNTGMITNDEFVEVIPRLAGQTNEARDVLNNLLSWANSNKQGAEPSKKLINLNEGLKELLHSLVDEARKKGIALALIESELPNPIRLDKEGLTIVLRNMIKNSIKFCISGDQINFGCELKGDVLQFFIKDSGVGFDDSVGKKLFNELEHVTTFGTAKEKGTGIGLLICKNIIEQNSGQIWAESKPGHGASFYFTMPV
jgi:signal transduction histidine kinase